MGKQRMWQLVFGFERPGVGIANDIGNNPPPCGRTHKKLAGAWICTASEKMK